MARVYGSKALPFGEGMAQAVRSVHFGGGGAFAVIEFVFRNQYTGAAPKDMAADWAMTTPSGFGAGRFDTMDNNVNHDSFTPYVKPEGKSISPFVRSHVYSFGGFTLNDKKTTTVTETEVIIDASHYEVALGHNSPTGPRVGVEAGAVGDPSHGIPSVPRDPTPRRWASQLEATFEGFGGGLYAARQWTGNDLLTLNDITVVFVIDSQHTVTTSTTTHIDRLEGFVIINLGLLRGILAKRNQDPTKVAFNIDVPSFGRAGSLYQVTVKAYKKDLVEPYSAFYFFDGYSNDGGAVPAKNRTITVNTNGAALSGA